MSRITRDQAFMTISKTISERGTCDRLRVGAIAVLDNRIVSTGYNGSPAGSPHCIDVGCLVSDGSEGCIRTIHAEANVIAFAARHGVSLQGAILYCTHSPCINCAKLIINSGIREVVFGEEYRDDSPLSILRLSCITVRKHA